MNFSEIFPGVTISQFAPNGQFLVLSNGSKVIVKEVQQLTTIPFTHTLAQETLSQIEISPNSEFIALSYPKRGYVEVRKIDDVNWMAKIEDSVESIKWCPDSQQIIVISEFQVKASIYNLCTKQVVHLRNPKQFGFSRCGNFVGMLERKDAKDYVGIYSIKDWKLLNYSNTDTLDAVSIEWSHNDAFIAVQDSELNYRLNLHCPCQGLLLKYEPYQFALGIRISRFANQSDLIAIGSHDEKVRILNLLTLRQVVELENKLQKGTIIYKEEEYADQYSQRVITKFVQVDGNIRLPIVKTTISGVSQLEWSYKDEYIAVVQYKYQYQYQKNDNNPNCLFIWEMETLTLKSVLVQLLPIKSFIWSKTSTHLSICSGSSKLFFWSPSCTSACDMPFDKGFHVNKLEWTADSKSLLLQDKADVVVAYPQLDDSF